MIDAIMSLVDTVGVVIDFLINSFNAIVSLIINIPTYSSMVFSLLSLMPSYLAPFSIACVTLVIVQYISRQHST